MKERFRLVAAFRVVAAYAGQGVRGGVLGLALAVCACATPPGLEAAAAPEPTRFEGSAYSNPEFGLELRLPPGWIFLPAEEQAAQVALTRPEAVAGPTRVLFVAFSLLDTTNGMEVPRSIAAVVEPLPADVTGLTAETYALVMRQSLNRMDAPFEFASAPEPASVGGQSFRRLHADYPGSEVQQDYFVRVIQQHGFALITTYVEPDDPEVRGVLDAIELSR